MTKIKKAIGLLALVLVLGVAYLSLWPVPIDPQIWQTVKEPGYVGPFAVNQQLVNLQRI